MKKKEEKTCIDYDKIIENSFFYNLIKVVLLEFCKIKRNYKMEILIDLTDKKIKIPNNYRKKYNQDEVTIEINSAESRLEFKKDYFITYIMNNKNHEIYKIEIPYSAVLCLTDKETGYMLDRSIIDFIKDSMNDGGDIEKYEYDSDDFSDDNKFINAIINITSRCITGDIFNNRNNLRRKKMKDLRKIKSEEQDNKIIYFKNLLTTDRD